MHCGPYLESLGRNDVVRVVPCGAVLFCVNVQSDSLGELDPDVVCSVRGILSSKVDGTGEIMPASLVGQVGAAGPALRRVNPRHVMSRHVT